MAHSTFQGPSKPLPPGFHLLEQPPPVDAYLNLREQCKLSPKHASQAGPALQNSWYAISIVQSLLNVEPRERSEEPVYVGMGRVIGDGGWYFHVADMAVLPEFQRRGIGDFILGALLKRIVERAPSGDSWGPYVNLVADAPGRKLYARWGFVETAPGAVAMERRF